MTAPTYPLSFPTVVFREADIEPAFRQAAGMIASGQDYVVERGKPQWAGRWRTPRLSPVQLGQWEAFFGALEGGLNFFLGFDPLHELPESRRGNPFPPGQTVVGGGAFDGATAVTSIAVNRRSATLGTGIAGLVMQAGDQIALEEGGRHHLCRVIDTAPQTFTVGGAVTLALAPRIPAAFTTAARARLVRPCAKFRLVSYALPKTADGGERPGDVTLEGLSVAR